MILKPFQIVSLWELYMHQFPADRFIRLIRAIELLRTVQEGCEAVDLTEQGNVRLQKELTRNIKILCKILLDMGLQMSLVSAEKLERFLETSNNLGQPFCDLTEEVNSRIEDEIGLALCFIIRKDNEKFYTQKEPLFGRIVEDRFPELAMDTSEAGKCYALGRYTACVFHLMRIMEYLVQQMGLALSGKSAITEKSWHTIIEKILRPEIESRFPNEKDQNRIMWESTLGHLGSVRIAWRNPTMHPKETYTEEEAEGVLGAVKVFAQEITKVI
jgi:hypothetical protein